MKNPILLLLLVFCFSCASSKKASDSILPDPLKGKIQFGMTIEEFRESKIGVDLQTDKSQEFREVILEKVDHPDITNYIYYFDMDDDKPLYEIIVVCKSEELRDTAAEKLFGPSNFEGGEWRFKRPDSFNVMAWKFQKKLIIVGLLPKTEWYEDDQGTW